MSLIRVGEESEPVMKGGRGPSPLSPAGFEAVLGRELERQRDLSQSLLLLLPYGHGFPGSDLISHVNRLKTSMGDQPGNCSMSSRMLHLMCHSTEGLVFIS